MYSLLLFTFDKISFKNMPSMILLFKYKNCIPCCYLYLEQLNGQVSLTCQVTGLQSFYQAIFKAACHFS